MCRMPAILLGWSEFVGYFDQKCRQAQVKLLEDDAINRGWSRTWARPPTSVHRHDVTSSLIAALRGRDDTRRRNLLRKMQDQESGDSGIYLALVLALEEPELDQHPSRQRHLASDPIETCHWHDSGCSREYPSAFIPLGLPTARRGLDRLRTYPRSYERVLTIRMENQ